MEEKVKAESKGNEKLWTAGEVREVEGGIFVHIRAACLCACLSVPGAIYILLQEVEQGR